MHCSNQHASTSVTPPCCHRPRHPHEPAPGSALAHLGCAACSRGVGLRVEMCCQPGREACPEKQQLFIDTCLMHGCTARNYVCLDEVGTVSPNKGNASLIFRQGPFLTSPGCPCPACSSPRSLLPPLPVIPFVPSRTAESRTNAVAGFRRGRTQRHPR